MSKEFLRHYPYTFELDGEPVTVHIKRMNFEEAQDFYIRVADLEETVLAKQFYRRDGAEQEKDDSGNYKISFDELCQRRIAEMPPKDQEEVRLAEKAQIKEQNEFLAESIKRFIPHVEPGLIDVHPDGSKHPVTNGTELLDILGGRRDDILRLYAAIFVENRLSPRQKKIWKSRAGSSTSLERQETDLPGQKQETTVESAETGVYVGHVDA